MWARKAAAMVGATRRTVNRTGERTWKSFSVIVQCGNAPPPLPGDAFERSCR